jgi:hypothetical protein
LLSNGFSLEYFVMLESSHMLSSLLGDGFGQICLGWQWNNSTSFLLQNAQFLSVNTAVLGNTQGRTLLAGGTRVLVESWGFGRVATTSTDSVFYTGEEIPLMNRTGPLFASSG